MATEMAQFGLEGGGSVLVEVDSAPGVQRISKHGKALLDAKSTFEDALQDVRHAAGAALGQFQAMTERPSEVQITFGIKIDAQLGAVVAKTGLEGHFEVTLTWNPEKTAK